MTDWRTTLRGFLAHGGRVLIEPTGALEDSGGKARFLVEGDLPESEAAIAAHRAYFAQRAPADRAKMRRAALMLGRRTSNGWRVLEGREAAW